MWGIRFPAAQRTEIDAYAADHDISRAEAIRRLVDLGLNK